MEMRGACHFKRGEWYFRDPGSRLYSFAGLGIFNVFQCELGMKNWEKLGLAPFHGEWDSVVATGNSDLF